jgi:hypothetical protein
MRAGYDATDGGLLFWNSGNGKGTGIRMLVEAGAGLRHLVIHDGDLSLEGGTAFSTRVTATPTANRIHTIPDVADDTFVMQGVSPAAGDITGSYTAGLDIGTAAVTFAKFQDVKENSVLGRDTLASGVAQAMDETDLALATPAGVGDTYLGWTNTGLLRKFDAVVYPISETDGGTNQTTYTTGDMLYSDATNSLAKLAAGNTTGAIQILEQTSTIPAWTTVTDEKTFILENPGASEETTGIWFDRKVEVIEVRGVLLGALTTCTIDVGHDPQMNGTFDSVLTAPIEIVGKAGGTLGTLQTDGSEDIPANSWMWLKTTAGGGTGWISVNVRYRRIF